MNEKQPKNNVKKLSKAPKIDIKKMGVEIDKNEYREIVQSNSNRPENSYYNRDY